MLNREELAYAAGIIDTQGVLRLRKYEDSLLPMVAVHNSNILMLGYLARLTGTKVTKTRRLKMVGGCSEHCKDQHEHVMSESGRWSVSGAKATIMLNALRPHIQIQGYMADQIIEAGLSAPRKPATAQKMAALGWTLPEGW